MRLLWDSARAPNARQQLVGTSNRPQSGHSGSSASACSPGRAPRQARDISARLDHVGNADLVISGDVSNTGSPPSNFRETHHRGTVGWSSPFQLPSEATTLGQQSSGNLGCQASCPGHDFPSLALDDSYIGSPRDAAAFQLLDPEPESAATQNTSTVDMHYVCPLQSDSRPERFSGGLSPIAPTASIHSGDDSEAVSAAGPWLLPRHLDVLPDLPLQLPLLSYWTGYLCDAILALPSLYNPLRDVVMPIAMVGAMSPLGNSTAAAAVFHFVCVASAFQLSRINKNSVETQRLTRLALRHHNLGLGHLRRNLRTGKDEQNVPILAALTMCVIVEAITASKLGDPSWRIHFRGALGWIRTVDAQFWSRSKPACDVYQSFISLAILSLSPVILDGEHHSDDGLIDFHCPRELYHHDRLMGIPYDTLKAINVLNNSRMLGTAMSVDQMEMELCLAAPKPPPHGESQNQEARLMFHLSSAFYLATLIYFARTVRKRPVPAVRDLVEKSLQHLEATISCTSSAVSPPLWAVVLPAFEMASACLQGRLLQLLDHFLRRTHLEVWAKVKTLVTHLWAERERQDGDKDLPWQDMVRAEPDLRLIMV
ncbi:hypothetical protein ACKAV7_011830 [Fusarium commune]